MRYKGLLYLFFFSAITFVILLEFLFIYFPVPTNITDTRLQQINNINKKKFNTIYLGSSVTLELMGMNPYKYQDVYNMTTAAGTTLTGQYLLAKKVLSEVKADRVIFSFVPIMLSYDVYAKDNKQVSRFFNQPFNRSEFINELRKYENDYTVENEYFMSRQMYIDRFFLYLMKNVISDKKHINIDKVKDEKNIKDFSFECSGYTPMKAILDFSSKLHDIKMAKTNKHFIGEIAKLSEYANITLVLEPVPQSEYQTFIQSSAYIDLLAILKEFPSIKFIDTNKIVTFKDCFFKDHLHLKHEKTPLYEFIIFNKILS